MERNTPAIKKAPKINNKKIKFSEGAQVPAVAVSWRNLNAIPQLGALLYEKPTDRNT